MNKRDIKFLLTDLDILTSKEITEKEAELKAPEMIYHDREKIYEWEENNLTHEDILEALSAKQTQDIHTIRNICSLFAFVLCFFIIISIFLLLAIN